MSSAEPVDTMIAEVVPLNDLSRYARDTHDKLMACAASILESGHYILGPRVRQFEEVFASYCGATHCVGVANGTDALEIALRALGLGPGRVVLVAANAAMYGTSAVLASGAEPLFADVDVDTGLLTPASILDAIAGADSAPDAIIVTHLYGRLASVADISELCKARGIKLVEDCAQAHGARTSGGRCSGSIGDIGAFSFYPTKNLGAIGDGGAIVTSDETLAGRARQLRQYGWSRKYTNELVGGRNSRLDEIQAAFLAELLPDLDARNEKRRRIANRYSREIINSDIRVPPESGEDFVAHLYVVRCSRRSSLCDHLGKAGVAFDIHYPIPDHRQPVHSGRFSGVRLARTEQLCDEVVTLPCFPEMTDAEVRRVIEACNSWPKA